MGFKFLLKGEVNLLPKNPGVYVFKDGRKILYIGKAANIRERVRNHFNQPHLRQGFGGQAGFRDIFFINEVKKIGFISTGSEIEALILEANLIKKYKPKYNIVWRDDKNYFFVAITKEQFPRVFITHQPKLKIGLQPTLRPPGRHLWKLEINYVGPFVDGKALKQTLKVLRKIFPFRSCRILPKRPCLWYQLGYCLAPCLLKSRLAAEIPRTLTQIKKDSQRNTKNIFKILQGKKSQVLRGLKRAMENLSGLRDFEKAAKIRDQIIALEKVISHAHLSFAEQNLGGHARIFEEFKSFPKVNWPEIQKSLCQILKTNPPKFCKVKLRRARIEAYDISNIQGKLATGSMVTFINGLPDKNFYRRFKISGKFTPYRNEVSGAGPNDIAMIKEVLNRRFEHREWPLPDLILIDGGIGQLKAALQIKDLRLKIKEIRFIALAKKENKLYIEGKKEPILLKNLPREIFNLILQLRDEAHRFALTYHKKLREIDTFN